MAITVEVRGERGELLDRMAEGTFEFAHALPSYDDLDYPYLRLVDPYADTVFSGYQMAAVLPELERLHQDKPSKVLERVIEMARRCAVQIGTYLWLIGD
jgi:hypothetical protein